MGEATAQNHISLLNSVGDPNHRYLVSRLSLQVFYLWRHLLSTAPPFILWWTNFRNTICPPPPQLSLHRRAALSSNSNGTRTVYSRKNPKSSLYCEMSMIRIRLETAFFARFTILWTFSLRSPHPHFLQALLHMVVILLCSITFFLGVKLRQSRYLWRS
jgi:hypothetical protein